MSYASDGLSLHFNGISMLVNLHLILQMNNIIISYEKVVLSMPKPDGIGGGVNVFDSLHLKRRTFWKTNYLKVFMVPREQGEFFFF